MANRNPQLRQAYEQLKAGNRQQAAQMLQGLLREDRDNVQAWWLLANALEREDRKIKSLEKVLALDPNHDRARQLLNQLRPQTPAFTDDIDSVPPATSAASSERESAREIDGVTLKKDLPTPDDETTAEMSPIVFISSVGVVLLIVGLVVAALAFPTIEASFFPPPELITERYLAAALHDDEAALRLLYCPAERDDLPSELRRLRRDLEREGVPTDTDGANEIVVSGVSLDEISVEENTHIFQLTGNLTVTSDETTVTLNIGGLLGGDAYDAEDVQLSMQRNGLQWYICP